MNLVDRNTVVWWTLLLASAWLARAVNPWGALFWLAALLLDDLARWGFGRSLFDAALRRRVSWVALLWITLELKPDAARRTPHRPGAGLLPNIRA